jgi:hypothetical protein
MAKEREITFEDTADMPIELEVVPRRSPGYVTGAVRTPAPAVEGCPYCGTPGVRPHQSNCENCGAPLHAMRAMEHERAPISAGSSLPPAPPAPPAPGEAIVDGITSIPFGFWKRLPAYAFLAMILGNGCRCGGLSRHTNLALASLVVLGVVGLVLSFQRRP